MNIYIIGNSIVPRDNAPIELMPQLQKSIPECAFIEADPNENFIPEEDSLLIDTVEGIDRVRVFDDIYQFSSVTNVSMHDFDLSFHLRFLDKLHKLKHVQIIGIPQYIQISRVAPEVIAIIRSVLMGRKKI